ncbi:phosphonate metabolism transcriptional regulator PhnF [Paracoccus sp. (in: a-proteobacteria)]|uniref:phosphonate metabolism transcriptional regulator PhnF n=1 Tax=Paracoccus sp. TaxID=267 RepID=UPI0026DF6E4E|nr:phosphonate metabolism transcriptional regulator PhnF [Paracoccus sp. (in: a-proteobacteria)]MDO5648289.1 phosphonate metabolism transcriptional regulator PhnF [Paracoccus sp. (in: a-proteobacteria)]
MARSPLWQSIAAALRDDLAAGHYRPGDKLPTESELSARFGVNRHTVRRALSDLADAGLVHARRGAGVFVTAQPTDYPLGRRVRLSQNLAASGRTASRRFTRLETLPADGAESAALCLPLGDPVHVVEGVSFADGQPMALFRSVFPGRLDVLAAVQETGSITAALAACGVADYTRASTRITAKLASPVQAVALHLSPGAPLLRSVAVNVDAGGAPVEYGRTWFAGDRVSLTLGDYPS